MDDYQHNANAAHGPGELGRLKRMLSDAAGRADRLRLQASQLEAEARSLADMIDCTIGEEAAGLDKRVNARLGEAADQLASGVDCLDGVADSINEFLEML